MSSPTLSKQTFDVCPSSRVGVFGWGFFSVDYCQCYMTAAISDVEGTRTWVVLHTQLRWTVPKANICLSVCLSTCLPPPQLHSASSVSNPENSVWKPWRVVHPWESKNWKRLRIKKTQSRQGCCLLWVWYGQCHAMLTQQPRLEAILPPWPPSLQGWLLLAQLCQSLFPHKSSWEEKWGIKTGLFILKRLYFVWIFSYFC